MKVFVKIFVLLFTLISHSLAQGIMKIETDKSNYSYGDTIVVSVSIANNSDTSFSLWGSSSCLVRIGFNDVHFVIPCTADYTEYVFPPHSGRTWRWVLSPIAFGIPDKDGEQLIYAYSGQFSDSIKIIAPKYYGGTINVGMKIGVSSEDMQSLRDSINAIVTWTHNYPSLGTNEVWQVSGYSVDSLASIYSNDYRLEFFEVDRRLAYNNMIITSIESNDIAPDKYFLSQNYPNPFNPTTTIKFDIKEAGLVTLKIYDILGREVRTLLNEEKFAGSYSINFDGKGLTSGVYFYRIAIRSDRITAGSFFQIKKMVLLK